MRLVKWIAAGLSIMAALPALADCASGGDTNACLAQDLRDSDKRINAVYKALMDQLDEAGKKGLRDEQRSWLKARDKECALDAKESDREKWLQAILADQGKTVCVVRYTFQRVGQLDEQLKSQGKTPAADLPQAPKPPVLAPTAAAPIEPYLSYLDDGYAIRSLAAYTKGKWYFEVTVDRGGIASLGDVLLSIGLRSPELSIGRMEGIRRTAVGAGATNVGVAADLDEGYLYLRIDGAWQQQPGRVSPLQVKLGRPYWFSITGSSEVRALLNRGLIKIDLGYEPFRYAVPDGYRPYSGS